MLLSAGFGLKLAGGEYPTDQAGSTAPNGCVQPAEVSFNAPDLSLHTLDGQPVNLEELRGSVVLLNAWATWCPPCLAEIPDLNEYFRRHSIEEFTLIGVNIGEGRAVVNRFLEETRIEFPVWLDPHEQTLRALNTISLPYSIVIDREGEVQLAWSGATCLESLETAVTPLLRKN